MGGDVVEPQAFWWDLHVRDGDPYPRGLTLSVRVLARARLPAEGPGGGRPHDVRLRGQPSHRPAVHNHLLHQHEAVQLPLVGGARCHPRRVRHHPARVQVPGPPHRREEVLGRGREADAAAAGDGEAARPLPYLHQPADRPLDLSEVHFRSARRLLLRVPHQAVAHHGQEGGVPAQDVRRRDGGDGQAAGAALLALGSGVHRRLDGFHHRAQNGPPRLLRRRDARHRRAGRIQVRSRVHVSRAGSRRHVLRDVREDEDRAGARVRAVRLWPGHADAAHRLLQHWPARGCRDLLRAMVLHAGPQVARHWLGGVQSLRAARSDGFWLGGALRRREPEEEAR
mmetsp:Transcript_17451/g.37704  ORF Transcript_17451/g.37704 Transcript_17451/m.37704 type:complete len:339 (-) Transcript_17451:129-1145(-)